LDDELLSDHSDAESPMKIRSLVRLICVAMTAAAAAQVTLNNNAVEKMARARLGDDVIVSMIQGQAGNYDLTPDALIAMKREGISNKVLAALAAKGSTSGTAPAAVMTPAPAPPPPVAATDSYEDFDIGVYRKLRQAWIPVTSELVNWKTGGVVKSLITDGIIKGDVNGRIVGGSSSTQVNTPLEFLIKTADGVDATDFQLVHLHDKNDAREFRTVTGGVFHASGGATRDRVPFDQTKIAKRTYKLALPGNLEPGEYAFLAPGFTNSSVSGSIGKAYTFRVVE
jgi:hypothetical protein